MVFLSTKKSVIRYHRNFHPDCLGLAIIHLLNAWCYQRMQEESNKHSVAYVLFFTLDMIRVHQEIRHTYLQKLPSNCLGIRQLLDNTWCKEECKKYTNSLSAPYLEMIFISTKKPVRRNHRKYVTPLRRNRNFHPVSSDAATKHILDVRLMLSKKNARSIQITYLLRTWKWYSSQHQGIRHT